VRERAVARTTPELELSRLGQTRRLALRTLLTEFRAKGWRDVDGAALAMIERIERSGGHASPRVVAEATPEDFLAVNAVSRAALCRTLTSLAERRAG
jgi:hypothetical protein